MIVCRLRVCILVEDGVVVMERIRHGRDVRAHIMRRV